MDKAQQTEMAKSFLARHRAPPVLLLPNVWDALSARIFVAAGFDALATTSGGVAWALGYPDGELAPWAEVVAATTRIVRSAKVPVTADIEPDMARHRPKSGRMSPRSFKLVWWASIWRMAFTARSAASRMRPRGYAPLVKQRVRKACQSSCDIFQLQHGEESTRFAATVERCKTYLSAGANCVYPFGLRDPATIAAFVKAVGASVNITGRPGMSDAAALERIGVARITIASAPTLVVMSSIQKLAAELRATGGFEMLTATLRHPEAQELFQLKG